MRVLVAGVVAGVFVAVTITSAWAQSTIIGDNFRATHRGGGESGFVPPDAMGAVGPEHIMLLANGRFELYPKSPKRTGQDGVPISGQAGSLNDFWISTVSGVSSVSNFAFDPRVTYDPFAQRWYAVSVDSSHSANSGYLFAVSKTADPTDGWDGFRWDTDPNGGRWADFPMLGFDGDYVYISANELRLTINDVTRYPLYALPKADLLGAAPTVANRQKLMMDSSTNQVVRALDNLGPGVQPYHLWEESSVDVWIDRITESGGTLNGAISSASVRFSNTLGAPANARQPDGTLNLEVDGNRFSSRLVRVGGSYWGVYLRSSNSSAGTRPNIVRWFEIDAAALGSSPFQPLMQQGTIALGTPGSDDQDLHYPSIAVNEFGDVVIGFSASGPGSRQYPSAYAVVGHTSGTTTTFGDPIQLKAGTTSYQRLASGRNRWGDYSNTVVDPADPNIFWTFQEWASNGNIWNVQATELITFDTNERYWYHISDGAFAINLNWLAAPSPQASDHAVFSRGGAPYTVRFTKKRTNLRASVHQGAVTFDLHGNNYDLTSGSAALAALAVGAFGGRPALTVTGDGTLNTASAWIGSGYAADASMTITGPGTVWAVTGAAFVGGSHTTTGGQATVTLNDNAVATFGDRLHVYRSSEINLDSGAVTIGTGEVQTTPGAMRIHADGTLGGGGRVRADVASAGTVAPGDSVGILNIIGDYTQDPSGSLAIEVGGPNLGDDYDHLAITSDASLAGALLASLVDGFWPDEGDRFDILTTSAGTITGTFEVRTIDPADAVFNAAAIYSSTTVSLEVIDLFLLADMNADLLLDNLDIPPFIFALEANNNEATFLNEIPGGEFFSADTNRDSLINVLDVDPFIELLAAATGTSAAVLAPLVPEPATVLLFIAAALALRPARRGRRRKQGQQEVRRPGLCKR